MNKIILRSFAAFAVLIGWTCGLLAGNICSYGKLELAPAFAHIDVLESGHTVKSMDLPAVKADVNIQIIRGYGWTLKPTVLYGGSDSGRNQLFIAGVGIAHCTPINDIFTITPSVGVNYSHIKTRIHIPLFDMLLRGKAHFTEKFRSISPYVGLEFIIQPISCFRICTMVTYAWSYTHTVLEHLLTDKSHAKGPSYSAMIEYDLSKQWSINLGGTYNISLSKEKHGIRGSGGKLGIAYWYDI